MFPGEDLLQEGIAAFQAGDRAKAHELLEQVVEIDPENEQAWYYLAASESDPVLRTEYLEHVLEINPGNAKAREVLERIKQRIESAEPVVESVPVTRSANGDRGAGGARIRSLDPAMDAPGVAHDEAGSFKIPLNIPGAPARTTWETLARDGVALLRSGLDVVLRKPAAYADEVDRATWWRFWLIAGTAAVASAVISIVNALFIVIRYSTSLYGIISVLLTPFFFVAVGLTALFVGSYASHQYALRQGGGSGSFVKHAYTVAVVWAPILLLNSVLSFVFNLFGFGAWLITLLISIYQIYLIAEGFEHLHVFRDQNQKWITAVVMIVAMFLTSLVLGVIFGGLIVRGALPFSLF
jgi:Yip1 domain